MFDPRPSGRGVARSRCEQHTLQHATMMKYARRLLRRAESFGVEAELVIPVEVFIRDKWTCRICGKKIPKDSRPGRIKTHAHDYDPLSASIDHVVPHSAGGPHTYQNCATAHRRCNGFKNAAPDYVHEPNRKRRKRRQLPLDTKTLTVRFKNQTVRQSVSERGRQLYGLEDDCLIWTGTKPTPTGYASVYLVGGRVARVHRVAYELVHGEGSAEGLTVDHLCGVPLCCNVKHLEAVSNEENVRRRALWITECPKGHPFTDENTRITSGGHRSCRQCGRDAYHLDKVGHAFVLDPETPPHKRARCLTCRLEMESTPQFCPYGHEFTLENDNDKRDKQGKRVCNQCRRNKAHLKEFDHEFVLDRSNIESTRQRCLICFETARNATRCPRGHEYTEFTIEIDTAGYRKCAQCRLDLLHVPRYGHEFLIDTSYTGKKRRCLKCMARKESERASHCPGGHEMTPENTEIHSTRGSRSCLQCRLDASHIPAHGHAFLVDPHHTGKLRRCLTCQLEMENPTHCSKGHKLTPETTAYHTYTGRPLCVVCKLNRTHPKTHGHEYEIGLTTTGRRCCLTCDKQKRRTSQPQSG